MSKTLQRYKYLDALPAAYEACQVIETCDGGDEPMWVDIAGSLRRKRPFVGDIDLVVLDVTERNPWQRQHVGAALAMIGYTQTKDGERIAAFTRPGGPNIDLYYATREMRGITLLIRTGSAGHNMKLALLGKKRLPARTLAVSRGIVDTAGNVVASQTEEDCFRALGLAWIEPEEREAPEFDAMVRDE